MGSDASTVGLPNRALSMRCPVYADTAAYQDSPLWDRIRDATRIAPSLIKSALQGLQ
jgi:hypothetical protein